MKCPKCGFVSFPGLAQCKKCGHQFVEITKVDDEGPSLFYQSQDTAPVADVLISSRVDTQGDMAARAEEQHGPSLAAEDFFATPSPGSDKASDALIKSPNEPAWQEELSKRLGDFRRRHGGTSRKEERRRSANLDLDFDSTAETNRKLIEFPSPDTAESNTSEPQLQPELRSTSGFLEKILGGLGAKRGPIQDAGVEESGGTAPLEIELKSPKTGSILLVEEEASVPAAAPMGKRFLAGIIDALVLLVAAGLFALIFRQAGGSLSKSPVDLAVATFIAASLIMLYFGGSAVFASATPGSIWTGLELRTFEGNPPRKSDCFWRAFGYLISMSALMLGFVWALVDGDGLTWHDRMSRTSLVATTNQEKIP